MRRRHNIFSKNVVESCVKPEARKEDAAAKRGDFVGAAEHAAKKDSCKYLAESLKTKIYS